MYALYHLDWYMHSNVCIISPGICIPTFALYRLVYAFQRLHYEDPRIKTLGHDTSVKFKVSTATYKLTNHNQLEAHTSQSTW